MAGTARETLSVERIDDYVPQAQLCMRCGVEVESLTAHHGRIVETRVTPEGENAPKLLQGRVDGVKFKLHGGSIWKIDTVTETFFPRKVTGFCCSVCYTLLWNTTWRDKNGDLRRAFETIHREVIYPVRDEHEASPIVKGLYAPHVGKRRAGRPKADYFENATNDHKSVTIDDSRLPRDPEHDRKLTGFNRPERDDIKIDRNKRKVIAKGGKWKVNPAEYNYKPEEPKNKPRLNTTKKADRLSEADKAALRRIEAKMAEYKSPFADQDDE